MLLLAGFFPTIPAADSGLPVPTMWVFLFAAIIWFGMLLVGGVDKAIIGLTFIAGLAYVLTFIDGVAPISRFQTTFQYPANFIYNENTFWNGIFVILQQVNWWGAAERAVFIFAAINKIRARLIRLALPFPLLTNATSSSHSSFSKLTL